MSGVNLPAADKTTAILSQPQPPTSPPAPFARLKESLLLLNNLSLLPSLTEGQMAPR